MSIEFTDKNPSPDVNARLLASKLESKQEYEVRTFKENGSGTDKGKLVVCKIQLKQSVLKIEGIGEFNLNLCKCEWKDGDTILSVYPKDNLNIDIYFN